MDNLTIQEVLDNREKYNLALPFVEDRKSTRLNSSHA